MSWRKRLQRVNILMILAFSSLAILAVIKFHNLPQLQFQILMILAIGYLSWGFLHHLWDKTANFEIMIEYVLTAILVLIIYFGLLI